MTISLSKSALKSADALLVPCKKGGELAVGDAKLKKAIAPALADFKGNLGETLVLYPPKRSRVILFGVGEEEDYCFGYGAAIRKALDFEFTELNALVPDDADLRTIVDGMMLANDSFDELRKKKKKLVKKIGLIGVSDKELALAKKAATIGAAIHATRKLILGNADDITPQALAKFAKELSTRFTKVKTTVFTKEKIEKEKMGLLLAVSRGSSCDPTFIIVEYRGDPKSKDHTVVVGKGVTYDTGGLNLKPTGSMETMKTDMSGAATVLGMIQAAAETKLKANVTAVVAATENGIDANSYKPGDVYKGYSGKTVEIVNTDAEGRLTLADALAYAHKNLKPTRMINLATLTGSVVIALGEEVAGYWSNNDKLAGQLMEASEAVGEPIWRMPLRPSYKKLLKSEIADIANCGKRPGGSITAALFLQEFVGGTPWAHFDIAGVAYPDKATSLSPDRATGFGVRLLIDFLEKL